MTFYSVGFVSRLIIVEDIDHIPQAGIYVYTVQLIEPSIIYPLIFHPFIGMDLSLKTWQVIAISFPPIAILIGSSVR